MQFVLGDSLKLQSTGLMHNTMTPDLGLPLLAGLARATGEDLKPDINLSSIEPFCIYNINKTRILFLPNPDYSSSKPSCFTYPSENTATMSCFVWHYKIRS